MPETKKDKFEFYYSAAELRLLTDDEREHTFGMKISDTILDWRERNDGNTYISFTSDLIPEFEGEEGYVLVVNIIYEPRFVSMKEEISAAKSKVSDL
jgi:hypothetical protein